MSASNLEAVFQQIETELDFTPDFSAPLRDLDPLPDALRPLYARSDGIELPFGTIFPWAKHDHRCGPDWICFGQDHYFSYFLCRELPDQGGLSLVSCDHDSRQPISAVHADFIGWLEAEYRSHVDESRSWGDLHINEFPPEVALGEIVPLLKHLAPISSSAELLKALRTPPFVLEGVRCDEAIKLVRRLRARGTSASLQHIRPEREQTND